MGYTVPSMDKTPHSGAGAGGEGAATEGAAIGGAMAELGAAA